MADSPAPGKTRVLHAALGIALGLAFALGVIRVASRARGAAPPAPSVKLAGGILREDTGSMDEILVHYVPLFEPVVGDAYADFLGTLDPATRVVAVVPK